MKKFTMIIGILFLSATACEYSWHDKLEACYRHHNLSNKKECRGNENTEECTIRVCGQYHEIVYNRYQYCDGGSKWDNLCDSYKKMKVK